MGLSANEVVNCEDVLLSLKCSWIEPYDDIFRTRYKDTMRFQRYVDYVDYSCSQVYIYFYHYILLTNYQ